MPDPLGRARSLLLGGSMPIAALRLIARTPKLLGLSLLPIAITLALYFHGLAAAIESIRAWISASLVGFGLDPSGWTLAAAMLLASLALILVGAFTFSFVAALVASPFNDLLAESAEPLATPPLPSAGPPTWRHRARLIWIDVAKSLASTAASLLAVGLSWVPVLNAAALVLALLLMTFQYTSYPQTRRGQGIRSGLGFLFRHPFACLGFGAVVSVLFSVPVLSSFALPLAVVGGTLLVARAPGSPGHPRLR